MAHERDNVVGVTVDMVRVHCRGVVAFAVAPMIEQDACVRLRQWLDVASHPPKFDVGAGAQVENEQRARAFDLVIQPYPVVTRKERHARRLLRGDQRRQGAPCRRRHAPTGQVKSPRRAAS